MPHVSRAAAAALVALLAVSPRTGRIGAAEGADTLHAVLWMQTASEYRAIARQTYNVARARLRDALRDKSWTAALEQSAADDFESLPPAIIVDVDETVLDNSPYSARLIRSGESYSPETWRAWVAERKASPIPGALAFLHDAASRGVTVFYVTNRGVEDEADTRANLERLGFPLREGEVDVVLTENEGDDAGSEKAPRRRRIAESYRIVMLFGDNLGDFVPGARASRADRDRVMEDFAGWWGERWFMLPNPVYGSWERVIPDKRAALVTK